MGQGAITGRLIALWSAFVIVHQLRICRCECLFTRIFTWFHLELQTNRDQLIFTPFFKIILIVCSETGRIWIYAFTYVSCTHGHMGAFCSCRLQSTRDYLAISHLTLWVISAHTATVSGVTFVLALKQLISGSGVLQMLLFSCACLRVCVFAPFLTLQLTESCLHACFSSAHTHTHTLQMMSRLLQPKQAQTVRKMNFYTTLPPPLSFLTTVSCWSENNSWTRL